MQKHEGKFDADGFYILKGGDYYDPEGFYFNKQGFDEFGGYYDKNGDYLAPPNITLADDGAFVYVGEDYEDDNDDYYNELNPDDEDGSDHEEAEEEQQAPEDEEDIDDLGIDPNEITLGLRREHCLPVLKWLKDQETDKKHVLKIENLPRRATEAHVKGMLNRKIKNFKCEKFAIELKNNVSEGVAWLSSTDQYTVSQIIKMHYTVSKLCFNFYFQVYCGYKLRTYLIGYEYNANEFE